MTADPTAVCTLEQLDWTFNSQGQSPCVTASYLGGVCNAGQYTVGPLGPGEVYIGPTPENANACKCNSVFYSLVSACAACQSRRFIPWSSYKTNCTNSTVSVFSPGIPDGALVPHYAFDNVTADDTFNLTRAESAKGLDSSRVPQATGSATGSGPSPSRSLWTSTPSPSNTGTIAGGVVGGLVLLASITGVTIWWVCHLRARRGSAPPGGHVPYESASPLIGPATPLPFMKQAEQPVSRLYDPSDPRTFPMPSWTAFTGQPQHQYNRISTDGHFHTVDAPGHGYYTGAPEV